MLRLARRPIGAASPSCFVTGYSRFGAARRPAVATRLTTPQRSVTDPMRRLATAEALKSAGQVLAVIAGVAYVLLLLHKASVDVAIVKAAHPQSGFWQALGRHLLRVLGGG